MSLWSAEALLLDVVDLGEQDRIVVFLTAEQGKKRGVAQGARRKHSRFTGQLQPLGKARVSWFERSGRELTRIRSLELVRPPALGGDLEGLLLGAYLADHMLEFAQENEASAELYRLLDTTLEALAAGVDRDLAGRYYELWVLRLAGVFPPLDRCAGCDRELGAEARLPASAEGFLCRSCAPAGGLRVDAGALELVRRSARENLASLAARAPSPAELAVVAEATARIRRSFLQHELKSHRVIRETLAGLPPEPASG